MIVDRKVFVPMRDGVRVALTTYLPEGAGRFPVVVESVPYRKDDDCYVRDWQNYLYLADRGIAGVRIDIRGTGASEGVITDEYTAAEMADTVEVLHWAAEQPWSNGNIGMWGISWGGFSSLQTAMLRPEPLQAIMPMHATHDRFATDIHYSGGSVMAAEQGDWPASMIGLNALPPDPEIVGDRWREMWMQRLDQTPQWIFEWFRHQRRDDYWRHGSPCANYGSIAVPTLLIGGWLDGYVDGMLAMLKKLTCPRRAVIGPWGHYRPATGVPEPTFDHFDLMARWFGHHLRGDDNGVMDMPELTSWVRTEPPYDGAVTTGYWRGDRIWSEGMKWLLPLPGSEPLVWRGPQWVGSHAPAWDRAGTPSTDSGPDDAESVVFESEPFAQPLSFLGQPLVRLMVNSDQPFGLVAVRLSAVSPSAEAHLISRGSRNLAFPDDLADPHAVIEGEWRLVEVPLLAAAVSIPAGWRLRLAIAGADFPIIWPPARQFSLAIDPERSSAVLPLLPEGGGILDIPPTPRPPPAPVDIDEDTFDFGVERNGGKATFRRNVAHRERQPGGLVYESQQHSLTTVEDGDPASMAVNSTGSIRLTRGEWQVGSTYALDIATSPSNFQIEIRLQTQEFGTEVFSRTWSDSIVREWG
ncbi:CocE/NonD family hydrolase [soil metagenome]